MNVIRRLTKQNTFRVEAALFCCWLLSFIFSSQVNRTADDLLYVKQLGEMSPLSWVIMRYKIWSGRLFSEIATSLLIPLPNIVWSICNALFLTLLAYAVSRVAFGRAQAYKIIFSYASFWLIAPRVLDESTFWLAGSVAYLWPTALAVFACIPLTDMMRGRKTKYGFVYVIAAFLGSLGAEQVGPCIFAFAFISLGYAYLKKHKISFISLGISIASGLGLIIELTCPGMHARSISERHWYPGFDKLPFYKKAGAGITWEFGGFANYLFMLLALIVVSLIVSVNASQNLDGIKQERSFRCKWFYNVVFGFSAGLLFILCFHDELHLNTSLFAFPKHRQGSFLHWILPYLFWLVFLVCIAILVWEFVKEKLLILLLFLASICSAAVMWFSPTIYASGRRTFFVSGVLLMIILCVIQSQFKNKIIYGLVSVVAFANYLNMLRVILLTGFNLFLFS